MSLRKRILLLALAWVALVSGLHAYLKVNSPALMNDYVPEANRKLNIAFIPGASRLACPVTGHISKFSKAGEIFRARIFQGFPEIVESGFSVA